MEKVFFTGMNMISSLGIGKKENHDNFYSGINSIDEMIREEKTPLVATVKSYDIDSYFPSRVTRRMESYSKTLLATAKLTMEDAGYQGENSERYGSIFSTYWGPLQVTEEFFTELVKEGPLQAKPMLFPCLVTNASLGRVAKNFSLKGVSSYLVGINPLSYAYNFIARKNVPGILVGTFDEIYAHNYEALDEHNYIKKDAKEKEVRPFVCDTKGVCLGEAAVVCLLESESQAKERQSRKLAELVSVESRFCPLLVNAIKEEDAVERMTNNMLRAIEKAGLHVEDITCVVAAADGDSTIDAIEKKALRNVFEDKMEQVAVVAPKEQYGEVVSSGSLLSCLVAADILETQVLPPCTNVLDNQGNVKRMKDTALTAKASYVLCNSFVPGSNIDTMILGKA